MDGLNISVKEKYFDRWTLIVFIVINFIGDICVLATPFLYGSYEDLGYTWFVNIWGFGSWVELNRIDSDLTARGSYLELDGFLPIMIAILIISLVVITVSTFFLGRNRWRSNVLQRCVGGVISFSAILGLTFVTLFSNYHLRFSEPYLTYSGGFYLSIIFFSFVFFAGMKNVLMPTQHLEPKRISKPKKVKQPVKDKKRSKLIDYIEEIDEPTENGG